MAILRAPAQLSSCSNAAIQLDASYSLSGGVKPLRYTLYALPTACDNYKPIAAALAAASLSDTDPTVSLDATLLAGGFSFAFRLSATSFLGIESEPVSISVTRAALPIPTLHRRAC